MTIDHDLHSDLPIPPGEYLQEVLEDLSMSQADLARRMGRPAQVINELVKGTKSLTPDTALQLEQVTGVPANVWVGLEEEFQLVKARRQEFERREQEVSLVEADLYNALAKLGHVPKVRSKVEKVGEVQRFFGVASLRSVPDIRQYNAAFRVSKSGAISPYAVAAWLRCGELAALAMDLRPFSASELKALLPKIRAWTTTPPEYFLPRLESSLAACGVALVLLPHLPRTRAQGATFWISPEKVVVQMSIRGKWADVFWFSLLHELGHVLLHGKRQVFLEDGLGDDPAVRRSEDEANAFARDHLIPFRIFEKFAVSGRYTREGIEAFAREAGVAPGIVVGRLHHHGLLKHHQFNDLRERYTWAERR